MVFYKREQAIVPFPSKLKQFLKPLVARVVRFITQRPALRLRLVALISAHPRLKVKLWHLAHAAKAGDTSRRRLSSMHSTDPLELSPRAREILRDLRPRETKSNQRAK